MEIYATPCNGIRECADDSDESGCKNNTIQYLVILLSLLTIFLMFVALRFSIGSFIEKLKSLPKSNPKSLTELLKNYEKDLNNKQIIEEVNLYLYHSIHTQTNEQKQKNICIIFDFLAEKNQENEAGFHFYLHNNFDPELVQTMFDIKFPGIKDALIGNFKKVARKPIINRLTNMVTIRSEVATSLSEPIRRV